MEQVPVAALFAGAAKAFSRVSYLPIDGEIQGDGALLQSLVNNLVKNALEAGATQVELSFREGCLTVTDNGCGMDEATLAMARTPPRRGSMTGNKGMGLACAIGSPPCTGPAFPSLPRWSWGPRYRWISQLPNIPLTIW